MNHDNSFYSLLLCYYVTKFDKYSNFKFFRDPKLKSLELFFYNFHTELQIFESVNEKIYFKF